MRKAVDAGNVEGYAALTQMARDRGDEASELRWAELGAEAGVIFCLQTYGSHLSFTSQSNPAGMRRALAYLSAAADHGNIDAMMMAGATSMQLNDETSARVYFDRARATGDPQALDQLEKWGM